MNSGPTITLLRALFIVFAGFLGSEIGNSIWGLPKLGICAGVAFGLSVVLADRLLKGFSLRLFSSATFGLLLGLVSSRLLLASGLLYWTPPDVQWLISLTIYATLGYLGMMLAMRSNRDEFALIIPYIRFRDQSPNDMPILVDSNIIIDGRLAELVATGFLSRSLVVPRFILEELQTLADSHDPVRREKGRLALAKLQELQRDLRSPSPSTKSPWIHSPRWTRSSSSSRKCSARASSRTMATCAASRACRASPR